jgi:hypothetical protein
MYKELEMSHHKFYKSMKTSKRDLDQNLENLAIEREYSPEMGKRVRERVRIGDRMPVPIIALKPSEIDDKPPNNPQPGPTAVQYLKSI